MRVNFESSFRKISFDGTPKYAARTACAPFFNIKKAQKSNLGSLTADTFTKSSFTLRDFYNKSDKLQISDYKKMTSRVKKQIRKSAPKSIHNAAETNIDIALDLKKVLDKQYGKNGYVFVSIGRSPSLIAKVLENTGVETKYLPISHIGEEKATHSSITRELDVEKYSNLLKEQGLSPLKMLFTPKKYLFYDYTDKGKSLKMFEELLVKTFHLPKPKMEFKSLNLDLLAADYDDESKIFGYIDEYLKHSLSEKYSNIARLDYFKTKENDFSTESLTKYNDMDVKLYNFLVMDKLNRYKLLSENPRNKASL